MNHYRELVSFNCYDTAAELQAWPDTVIFFQRPAGVGGKTMHETSMMLSGRLLAPQVAHVTELRLLFYGQLFTDAPEIVRRAMCTFTIGSKLIFRGLVRSMDQANGYTCAACGHVEKPPIEHAEAANAHVRIVKFHTPAYLAEAMQFEVRLEMDHGFLLSDKTVVVCQLSGLLERPIQ